MELPDAARIIEPVRNALPELLYPSVAAAAEINRRRIEQNVAYFRANPEGLESRLAELRQEWDVDRVLHTGVCAGSLAGFWLALTKGRAWLALPLLLSTGGLHHAVTGRSPAADLLRRMGVRTRAEIEAEMEALARLDREGT